LSVITSTVVGFESKICLAWILIIYLIY
jgi:hypothetical protein